MSQIKFISGYVAKIFARQSSFTAPESLSASKNPRLIPLTAKITKVNNLGAAYRCFYKPDIGAQYWRVGDQALCKNAGRYYWRLVTSISSLPTDEGEHWISLSVATADGSGTPSVDDEVVLLGHRGADATRRSATVLSSGTLGYPNPFTHYKGIDSFTLAGKERTTIGDNSRFVANSFVIETPEGDLYEVPRERGAPT